MFTITAMQKKILVVSLIVMISFWHYATGTSHAVSHVLHREFYLIPIILAAYWFGKKGGLTVSVIASLLFLPWAFMSAHVSTSYHLNNIFQVLMFNGVAYLLGIYRDARRAQFTTFWHPGEGSLSPDRAAGRHVLVCIDNSENALKTAEFVVDYFARDGATAVTILGFIREPMEDLFADQMEYRRAAEESEVTLTELVQNGRRILVEGGFPPEAVRIKTIRLKKETMGAKLLEEQQRMGCDSVVVAGTRMSRTEEFIFGNPAVKLVRESRCPVITVF